MTQELVSDGEKKFILDGIRNNIRVDGRQRLDTSPFCIELDILPYCVCSAKVSLHSTQVLVALKLEVDTPDTDFPEQGKIQCSVRYSPCAAPWKRNYELEAINFDLSRQLQNIMGDANGLNLSDLCIIKHRLCWVIHIDATVLQNEGNVLDSICLGCNACFKTLRIPTLDIQDAEQYNHSDSDSDSDSDQEAETEQSSKQSKQQSNKNSLFKNTEISKKATIDRMQRQNKARHSKHSGQQLPFQQSMETHKQASQTIKPGELRDIAEIRYTIDETKRRPLVTVDNANGGVPVVVSMAVMDGSQFFVVDPLYAEELCCDLLIRIAVYANGNVSIIKHGESAIDPMLVFAMVEYGKQSGLEWMQVLDTHLQEEVEESDKGGLLDVFEDDKTELSEAEKKVVEDEMVEQLKALSFVTDELRKEKGEQNEDEEEEEDGQKEVEEDVEMERKVEGREETVVKKGKAAVGLNRETAAFVDDSSLNVTSSDSDDVREIIVID